MRVKPSILSRIDYLCLFFKCSCHYDYHRENDLPSIVGIDIEYSTSSLRWTNHGKEHREGDLPSNVWFDSFGQVDFRQYCKHGQLHREGGPAIIDDSYQNQNERSEIYYENGVRLKEDVHQKYEK